MKMAINGFSLHIRWLLFVSLVFMQQSCNIVMSLSLPTKKVALFIFGDSKYDAGNNNYFKTSFELQANYWPYGEAFFPSHTGRFSDGRIIPDFVANFAKLPLVPPYLDVRNEHYEMGVNFASAGAGALVETNQGLVLNLNFQLSYFKTVVNKLKSELGNSAARNLLNRAVYMISIGSSDYLIPFTKNSSETQVLYSNEEMLVNMVIGNLSTLIQGIYNVGGRKFGLVNLLPLGGMPAIRLINAQRKDADLVKEANALVELHNKALLHVLESQLSRLNGFKYSYTDLYFLATQRMNHPSAFGKNIRFQGGETGMLRGWSI